jgi:acetyl esterase/lipase
MISNKAKAVFKAIEMIKFKETMSFDHPRRTKLNYVPLVLYFKNDLVQLEIQGRNVYKIVPKDNPSDFHVVFFHGGGYAHESSINHFLMINKFVNLSNCRVTFVEYPLVPEANVHQTLSMVKETYALLVDQYPDHRFVIMGDSAGGGLALALSMLIRDLKMKQPEKIVLMSPWLDISMTNPDIHLYDERDLILNLESLEDVGSRYAADLPKDDFRVSPIYGDLNHLGEILVLYGTDEVLKPDCDKFCQMQNLKGTHINCSVYEEMQHDWVIMPLPEQEDALAEISEFIHG